MVAPNIPPIESAILPGAGVRLHAVVSGPADGEPVVLLHGFPEFWYGWRKQIGPLAAAGFRVIAPDQRGYNASDKPPRVEDYAIDKLAADVVAVLDHLGLPRAAVVGHDWGGGIGWWLALTRPDRLSRLVVLNCPHPEAMARAVTGDLGQLMRSWYIFAMQLPRLPEWGFRRNGYRSLADTMRQTSAPGTFTDAELDVYRQAWAQPGALTGMVNWYRAAVRHSPPIPQHPRVTVPTLLIWGGRDRFAKPKLARASIDFCDAGRLEYWPWASHWVQHEEAARVNRLLTDFLRADPAVVHRSMDVTHV
jgi:pimeloyl-ACP methyl ester carboxylesterase